MILNDNDNTVNYIDDDMSTTVSSVSDSEYIYDFNNMIVDNFHINSTDNSYLRNILYI